MRWGRNAHFYAKPFVFVCFYVLIEWVRLESSTVGHLVQPPCSSGVVLERIAQDCTQMVLEYVLGRETPHPLWVFCPSAGSLHSKKLFLMFRWNFCALASAHCSCPVAWHYHTVPGPSFWNTPFRYWYTLVRSWLPQPFLLREML